MDNRVKQNREEKRNGQKEKTLEEKKGGYEDRRVSKLRKVTGRRHTDRNKESNVHFKKIRNKKQNKRNSLTSV